MSVPRNHHYVPEHFLRAWATGQQKTKVNRYRRIAHTGQIEFRCDVSIRSCASEQDLYVISDGTDAAEFETTVMTDQVDTPGAQVIAKVRDNGLASLDNGMEDSAIGRNANELLTLAKYIVSLEVRNPKTIESMQLSEIELQRVCEAASSSGSAASVDELMALLGRIDTGKYNAGLIAALDYDFPQQILQCYPLEIKFLGDCLVTSSYPVGRVGNYTARFLLSLSVAPDYALVWFPSTEMRTLVQQLPRESQAKLVNFLTLGNANAAFTKLDNPDPFVSDHLNWKKDLAFNQQKERLSNFLQTIFR